MTTRVEIDLNVRVRGNETYAGLEHVHGPIEVGQDVLAWESEDDIVGHATVTDIDMRRRLVYLAVDWRSLREAESR